MYFSKQLFLGALFEDGEDSMEAAFQHAINMTNQDRGI